MKKRESQKCNSQGFNSIWAREVFMQTEQIMRLIYLLCSAMWFIFDTM